MGVAGAGKSTLWTYLKVGIIENKRACKNIFKSHFWCQPDKYGGHPKNWTCIHVNTTRLGTTVHLPSFDGSVENGTDALGEIAAWLTIYYSTMIKLSGIMYLYSITGVPIQLHLHNFPQCSKLLMDLILQEFYSRNYRLGANWPERGQMTLRSACEYIKSTSLDASERMPNFAAHE